MKKAPSPESIPRSPPKRVDSFTPGVDAMNDTAVRMSESPFRVRWGTAPGRLGENVAAPPV